MEPDRKRGYYDNSSSSHQKRARPDDFHHPSGSAYVPQGPEVYSRLFLNQSTFAKVIGKGGAMIKNIRQQYGASMKGVDVNEEERMVSKRIVLCRSDDMMEWLRYIHILVVGGIRHVCSSDGHF